MTSELSPGSRAIPLVWLIISQTLNNYIGAAPILRCRFVWDTVGASNTTKKTRCTSSQKRTSLITKIQVYYCLTNIVSKLFNMSVSAKQADAPPRSLDDSEIKILILQTRKLVTGCKKRLSNRGVVFLLILLCSRKEMEAIV